MVLACELAGCGVACLSCAVFLVRSCLCQVSACLVQDTLGVHGLGVAAVSAVAGVSGSNGL